MSMAADPPPPAPAYRCDVILEPSQYTTISPPHPEHEKKHRSHHRPSEMYHQLKESNLSEDDVTDIVYAWVRSNPSLSSAPAKESVLTPMTHDVVYHYYLETFTEQRSVCMRFEPKATEPPITDTSNTQQPRPWMVKVSPAKMFCNAVCNFRLINTDQLRGCHYCEEEKWLKCPRCHGSGNRPCARVKAHRETPSKECSQCHGKREVPCPTCMALGKVCCRMCLGKGRLCYFKELRVEYRSHQETQLVTSCGIPEDKLLDAAGEVLHASTGIKLPPLAQFEVQQVNEVSRSMIEKSHQTWPNCKVIQQRHQLKAVPVTYVQYDWRGQSGGFYIYGTDHQVYWPDYPQRNDRCNLL